MMESLMMGAIMGICAVVAHNFVQRRARHVARLAARWRLPPRLLEVGITVLLSAPVAFVILYGLNVTGILTE
ncbi:MAG: hypothetical protein OXG02_04975 [Chloroflexi bacterium]|nr:hypothetical protein [Chloroflexota bacterium]